MRLWAPGPSGSSGYQQLSFNHLHQPADLPPTQAPIPPHTTIIRLEYALVLTANIGFSPDPWGIRLRPRRGEIAGSRARGPKAAGYRPAGAHAMGSHPVASYHGSSHHGASYHAASHDVGARPARVKPVHSRA